MIPPQIDLSLSSSKKIYEFILSAKEGSEQLALSLEHLIKHSVSSSEHFGFLLHRVSWFEPPFTSYREKLFKLLRLYRSCGKQSGRVVHNLLIESFFSPKSYQEALAVLTRLIKEGNDQQQIVSALRENYPHKLCTAEIHSFYLGNLLQLAISFPHFRTDFLEIIVENLAKIDTEVLSGDDWVHRPFPNDQKLLDLRECSGRNELALKLDALLVQLLEYLQTLSADGAVLDEMLLVFQNKVLPIKTTKNIQLVVFFLAEQSKDRSNAFIAFLLASIFEGQHSQHWYRILAQSNFYLFSYLLRSKRVTPKTRVKTFFFLVERLNKMLAEIEVEPIDERVELKRLLQTR